MRKELIEWYVLNKIRVRISIEKVKGKITDILIQLEIFDKKGYEKPLEILSIKMEKKKKSSLAINPLKKS